jgi:hypothetical protein
MELEYRNLDELHKIFKSYFPNHYYIKFDWQLLEGVTKKLRIIQVTVSNTLQGGEGVERWSLEYAATIFTQPKEMELCVKRWLDAFSEVKKPTLN